jgi:hypothetical protein
MDHHYFDCPAPHKCFTINNTEYHPDENGYYVVHANGRCAYVDESSSCSWDEYNDSQDWFRDDDEEIL